MQMSMSGDLFPVQELVEAIRSYCRVFPPTLAQLTEMASEHLQYTVVETPAGELPSAVVEHRARQIYLPLVDEPLRLRMLLREVGEILLRTPIAAEWHAKGEYARRHTAHLLEVSAERCQLAVDARDLRSQLAAAGRELKGRVDGVVRRPQSAGDELAALAARMTEIARKLAAAEDRISHICAELGDEEF